jgi:DNA-directed RNA polymerase subunit M
MKFCPKCNSLLIPTKEGLICTNCGYKEASVAIELKEEIKKKKPSITQADGAVEDTRPTLKVDCPKCGHNEAYWYSQQTRAADEPETQFFICKKCGYRWRKY